MGQDNGRLALALQRLERVQQEGIVAVLCRRHAELETTVLLFEPIAPRLFRERGIHHHEVEGLELGALRELRTGDRVALEDLGVPGEIVEDHVHPGQGPGGIVLLLAVDREASGCLGRRLDEERPGAAGGIVDGLVLAGAGVDADHLGEDSRDLGGRVELALALAGLGGEVAHQVLVGVPEEVIALGPAPPEVQVAEDRHELGEPVLHLLAFAELLLVVEVGLVDDLLQAVGFGELGDDLVESCRRSPCRP